MARAGVVFLVSLLVGFTAHGKDFSSWRKYTQAELVAENNAFAPGAPATLGLKIKLSPKWHTYWLNPGDSGTPIHLSFKMGRGAVVTQVLFPQPKREVTGPLISFAYDDEVLFPIELQLSRLLKPGDKISAEVAVEWLVCNDVCIPAFETLRLEIPVVDLKEIQPSSDFALFQKTRTLIPALAADATQFQFEGSTVRLTVPYSFNDDEIIDFFPFSASGVSNAKARVEGRILIFDKSNVPPANAKRTGVLLYKSHVSGRIESAQFGDSGWNFENASNSPRAGFLWMLISAFLGGLILNLMPCVFPILSMKLLSLLKIARADAREVRQQNLAYVAGVLISFLGIASLLSVLRSAGHLIGWGFQLQSPVFLSLLTWVFFILALDLVGVVEFSWIDAGVGDGLTRLKGLWGSFFTGFLAVVVASPCTAPFMGVALGFGLAQPTPMLLAIFFMLGLGMSFPYLLFVIFPAWARYLPRPGAWMNVFKRVMAVPLLLTAAWLVWVLAQVRGGDSVAVVVLGCLVVGILLKMRARRIAGLVLLAGLTYIYHSEHRAPIESEQSLWQPFSEPRLQSLRGEKVFVNITADWCLTCKVNERLVFDDAEVQLLLRTKKVRWLKGDWTERNEDITLFLNRYERVGVPFYVLFSARDVTGTPLPEVLTKSSFIDLIKQEFP